MQVGFFVALTWINLYRLAPKNRFRSSGSHWSSFFLGMSIPTRTGVGGLGVFGSIGPKNSAVCISSSVTLMENR
jgi:hypothetical protein